MSGCSSAWQQHRTQPTSSGEIPTHNCVGSPWAAAGEQRVLTIPAHSPAASPRGCRVTGSFTETISAVPDRAGTPCMAAISSASGMHQPCEEAPRDAGSRQVLPWAVFSGELGQGLLGSADRAQGLLQRPVLSLPVQQQPPTVTLALSFCPAAQDCFGCCPKTRPSSG